MHERKAEGSEPGESMLLRSRMRAAGEPAMPDGSAGDVCDDADDNWSSERVVRGAVELAGMRVLPERDDDDLSRIHVRDRYTVAATREDSIDGSNVGMRHERRRDSRGDDRVDERDTGELQSGESDDTGECVVRADIDVSIPGDVLRRAVDDNHHDDVLSGRQQSVLPEHGGGHEGKDATVCVGGGRAGGVMWVTRWGGPCGGLQDVLIAGACFTFTHFVPGANPPGSANIIGTVTSVFAVDVANPANRINAQDFTIINANLLDAH